MNRQFANCVKQQLLQHVQGYVKFWLNGDDMQITIFAPNGSIFKYTHQQLSSAIWQGFTSEICTQIILKRYKQYIRNLYFK